MNVDWRRSLILSSSRVNMYSAATTTFHMKMPNDMATRTTIMQVQVTRIHEAGGGAAADASGFSAAAESH